MVSISLRGGRRLSPTLVLFAHPSRSLDRLVMSTPHPNERLRSTQWLKPWNGGRSSAGGIAGRGLRTAPQLKPLTEREGDFARSAWDASQNPFSAFLHVTALDRGPSDIVRVQFFDRIMSWIFVGVVEGCPINVLRMRRKVVPDRKRKVGVRWIGHTAPFIFSLKDNSKSRILRF